MKRGLVAAWCAVAHLSLPTVGHHRLPPDCPPPKVAAPRRPGSSRVVDSRVELSSSSSSTPGPDRSDKQQAADAGVRGRQLALDLLLLPYVNLNIIFFLGQTV